MQSFPDIPAFEKYADADAKRADYNPVRFINVETMAMWVQVKAFLSKHVQKVIKVSEYCENTDIAPNINKIKKAIRLSSELTLVVPLSEYLRINNTIAERSLTDIIHADFECNVDGKFRIYILLYRMKDVLSTIQTGPREENVVSIIGEGIESDYSLTIIQKDLDFKMLGNEIDGMKKYFVYWEQNPDKPIILRTENAINYSDIIFSDNVKVIVTAFNLLQCIGLPSLFQESMGNVKQWQELASKYSNNSFDNTACALLSVAQYSDALFENWSSYAPFKQWLLWLWGRFYSKNPFLEQTFKTNTSVEDFLENLYLDIIDNLGQNNYEVMYGLRKYLLKATNYYDPKRNQNVRYNNLSQIEMLQCLTDNSSNERESIISIISEIGLSDEVKRIIKITYPDLYAYLYRESFYDKELELYFNEYKVCKITNKATETFIKKVDDISAQHGKVFWKLSARNSIIDELYNANSVVFFVDALGAEYLGIIQSLFDENKYELDINIGHCNLPSITEYNNDFYKNKNHLNPYYELDKWKHSNCLFPTSIENEFYLLTKLKEIVNEALKSYKSVIIAADHGTSRLAVVAKGQSFPANENAQKYKYGRYCMDSNNDYSEISGCLSYTDNEKQYWIFANYNKFDQKGMAICEIHGGASLEEMVVPVIKVSLKSSSVLKEQIKEKFEIVVLTQKNQLPFNKKITIKFKTNSSYGHLRVSVDNEKYDCIYADDIYSFEQTVITNKSSFVAKVICDNSIIGEFAYSVEHPMQQNKRFDI